MQVKSEETDLICLFTVAVMLRKLVEMLHVILVPLELFC
jgi:hypothetical protein